MVSISDIVELYGLPEETVEEILLAAFSHSLTNSFGYEVEALMNDAGALALYGYPSRHGELQVRNIPLERIGRPAIRQIRRTLTEDLVRRRILQEYDLLRQLTGRVLEGMVTKTLEKGPIFVKLYHDDLCLGKNTVTGTCPFRSQTPRERQTYRPGDVLAFHVLKIFPVSEDGMPRIDIVLSRNSKGLVEGLLMKQIRQDPAMGSTKVRCVKRIAGAYSVIESPVPLPLKAVKNVSDELKEYVRVVRLR